MPRYIPKKIETKKKKKKEKKIETRYLHKN